MHLDWQRLPGHRHLKGRAGHTATLLGKDIYVVGGRNGNEFFNDVWAFDTEIEQWRLVQAKAPFQPRAYHTCTLIRDSELWIIGGSDPTTMYSDVYVFDTVSLKWSIPALSGASARKSRGTHAAVLYPLKKDAILVYGGYGGAQSSWMSDLLVLHTDTLEWEELKPQGSKPSGRGYHTLTAFGNHVVLFGGKAESGILKDDMLSIYDVTRNRWISPKVKGELPSPRSNHAAALLENGMILFHGGRHGSLRLSDAYVLQFPPLTDVGPNLELRCHVIERSRSPSGQRKASGASPSGRSAHSLVTKGRALYIFGGYGGQGLTYNDIFVLRKLPRLPAVTQDVEKYQRLPSNQQLLVEVLDVTDEKEKAVGDEGAVGGYSSNDGEEGWRSTKRPRLSTGKVDRLLEKGAVSLQEKTLEEKHDNVDCSKQMTAVTLDILSRKVEEVARPAEKEQYKHLDELMGSLIANIGEKVVMDKRADQLEEEKQRLHKEKLDFEAKLTALEKKLVIQSKKNRRLEKENMDIKSLVQDLKSEIEDKDNARKMEVSKVNELEKLLKEVTESLEEEKIVASKAALEGDKLKSCIKTLETELQKQMEALQLLSSRYETEKAFFTKEITERKGIADKLLTDLGVAKEFSRSLEETINRQTRQIEQEAAKINILQKENEALTCSKAVMASEHKQLLEAKEGYEASCSQLRSELQAVKLVLEQKAAEITRLEEILEQQREHTTTLHDSLKKSEEMFEVQKNENEKLRSLMREAEEFEKAQARLIQGHAEKLCCARQSCPS